MDDMVNRGERDGKPKYEPSMSIIGWLVGALVLWSLVLIPFVIPS